MQENMKGYKKFCEFYLELPNKSNIFYMFLTSGLLQWLRKSASMIPEHCNLVLIGAGLEKEEVDWIQRHFHRPFYLFEDFLDVDIMWDILFNINTNNFGWIDIDCFILNDNLIAEISNINSSTSINCVWSDYLYDKHKVRTYFLFFNIDSIKKVKDVVPQVTPKSYLLKATPPNSTFLGADYFLPIDDHLMTLIHKVIPVDENNQYVYPIQQLKREDVYLEIFDTVVLYQLISEALGYKIGLTRLYPRDLMTNEAIHIGGSSHYKGIFHPSHEVISEKIRQEEIKHYKKALAVDYLLLSEAINTLPRSYKILLRIAKANLDRLSITEKKLTTNLWTLLISQGISIPTIKKVFQYYE